MSYSNQYIIGFAAGMCIFCSVFVSGSAVALKERQIQNKILDRQKNVISVSGLVEDVNAISPEEIQTLFSEKIHPKLINLETGEVHEDSVEVSCDNGEVRTLTVQDYDQQKALKDPCLSENAPSGMSAAPSSRGGGGGGGARDALGRARFAAGRAPLAASSSSSSSTTTRLFAAGRAPRAASSSPSSSSSWAAARPRRPRSSSRTAPASPAWSS